MLPVLESNPFQPTGIEPMVGSDGGTDFAPILHRWERYRLWYNGVLIAYTLLWSVLITPDLLLQGLFWFHLCFLGAVCNLCFFLGPAFEGYGCYFHVWNRFLSSLLFLAGLTFTVIMDTVFLIVRAQ